MDERGINFLSKFLQVFTTGHVKNSLVLQHLYVGFKVETRGHGTRKQVTQTKFEM